MLRLFRFNCKVQEVDRAVCLVVEVLGSVQLQRVAHVGREVLSVEVVVPRTALWNHEEP